MTERHDKDDEVDLYISPRRFVGCTPGPKAMKKKIFEEDQKREEERLGEKINFGLENIKYGPEFRDTKGDVHKKIGRNNALGMAVLIINYMVMVIGLILTAISVWVALGERNGGVAAYTFRQGFFIRSPLALGICLFAGGSAASLLGFFFGVKHLAPSIVEGVQESKRRTTLAHYHIAMSISVLLFGAILFSAISPLHHAKEHEITATLWREMSIRHPDRICDYEVANGCAGSKNQACLSSSASGNFACPGHYCENSCSAASSRPKVNDSSCKTCLTSFPSKSDLSRCKQSEAAKSTSGTCIPRLGSDVRQYFSIVIATSSVGLATMLCLTVIGTICPLLSING